MRPIAGRRLVVLDRDPAARKIVFVGADPALDVAMESGLDPLGAGMELRVYALEAPGRRVGVLVAGGAAAYCASFGGTRTKDEPGRLLARDAPAPAACPPPPACP